MIPITSREMILVHALRAATRGPRGTSSPTNYSVWDGEAELRTGLSRDQAVGFAEGLAHVGTAYGGHAYNPVVRCGAFVVWPEERYGEVIGIDE